MLIFHTHTSHYVENAGTGNRQIIRVINLLILMTNSELIQPGKKYLDRTKSLHVQVCKTME
jgi:hypothetical protein